jgi:hypothetical protein
MLITKHDLHQKRILEIGGGRGEFLRIICDRGNNHGVNIEPSYRPGPSEDTPANIRFITDYYTTRYRNEPADIIICRQVLEHFWGARDLLMAVREAVGKCLDRAVYFEVPNSDFILREQAFWEFHYQHVSYFTKKSLTKIFTICGFEVCELQEQFEGQLLGIEARAASPHVVSNKNNRADCEHTTAASLRGFGKDFRSKVANWREQLAVLDANGQRVVAWGAGAKAVTFLNIIDPDREVISHIVDINPRKTGCFVPGSGQEIVEPRALRELRPDVVLLMNAAYRDEIGSAIRALGLDPLILIV